MAGGWAAISEAEGVVATAVVARAGAKQAGEKEDMQAASRVGLTAGHVEGWKAEGSVVASLVG